MPAQFSNPVPLILLFTAIGFIVGAVVVYFVMLNRGPKTPDAGGGEPELPDERKNRFQEITGLWRERSGGKLAVWLDEKMTTDSQALDDMQRQRLESAGREFMTWLGASAAPLERPPEKPAPEPAPSQPDITPPPVEIAPRLVTLPVPASVAPAAAPDRPLSIVEQVNDILKEIVAGTPMEARLIRLSENPRQGVVVWVGTEHYDGVDNVPDPEVKAIIKQAGAEWERRTDKLRR
jgi:hypothetical protein